MARIIKQRVSVKLGRSIIGPVLPKLAVNGTPERQGMQEKRVQVICVSCGCEISLDQEVFCTYGGPAKCLSCSSTLPIKHFLDPPFGHRFQGSVISQENKRA